MKRFLKIVAIFALFTLAVAYVAFRAVFFDPFGSARSSLDPMIPKDVDFMLRRKELALDFEPFPMPRFFKSLRIKDEWEALARTRAWRYVEPGLGVREAFAELERLPERMEPLDPLQDLLGREAMVLGRWRQDGTLALAAIVRGSFRAKLFAEAVKLGVVRRAAGGLLEDYAEKDGVRSLTVVAQGQRQRIHLARSEDAIVAGDDFDLVKDVAALSSGGGAGIDRSPQYRAAILSPAPVGRTVDFVVDVADACKQLGLAWPAPREGDLPGLRFVRELLVPGRFGKAMGRLALGGQVEISAIVEADRAALRPAAGGLLDGASARLSDLHQFCGRVFPAKVAMCGCVRLDVKEFLRRLESLLEPEQRQLLNDFVMHLKSGDQQFEWKSSVEVLDGFAAVVADELAFAVEPDEAYKVPGSEEGVMQFPDPHWGPRMAFVFPVAEKHAASRFVNRFVNALKARPSAISNVWRWGYGPGRPEFWEVKSVDSDLPTYSIGMFELQGRECIVVTTTGAFLDEIARQKIVVDRGDPSGLQSELPYKQALEAASGFGQGFAYVSSPNLRKVLADLCSVWAEELTRPDWVAVRHDLERQVIARRFPQLVNRALGQPERQQIEAEVDREIEKLEEAWRRETLPAKVEELRADLEGLEMVRWLALALRVDERDLELRLRLATPANFASE